MSDLIDRQAAIDAIEKLVIPEDMCVFEILSHIELAIVTLPSAEPERKFGRWVTDDEFIDCSICRREKWSRVPYENLVKRFRYCPNCGAKMVEDDPSHPFADDVMMGKG